MKKTPPTPTPEEAAAAAAEAAAKRRARMLLRMENFYARITPSDCAGLSGQGEKVQYKHKHKSIKKHGGHPPADYTAVELLIDFKLAMDEGRFEEAVTNYFQLKRMLGW